MEDIQELRVGEFIKKLRADVARNRRIEAEARDEAERGERALAALEGFVGQPDRGADDQFTLGEIVAVDRANGTRPRGEEAVLRVMSEEPGQGWTGAAVHAALLGRGWVSADAKHPRAGTDAALSRLVKKGQVSRNEGLYHYMGGSAKD